MFLFLLCIRIFWGSWMNPMEMVPSPWSPPPNQTSPWRLDPLQRSRQLTVTLGTVLDQKKTCQVSAVACPLWRMHHSGQHQSLPWKIHTILIVMLAPFSLWHSSLLISSTGFIISFSEHCLQAAALLFSPSRSFSTSSFEAQYQLQLPGPERSVTRSRLQSDGHQLNFVFALTWKSENTVFICLFTK